MLTGLPLDLVNRWRQVYQSDAMKSIVIGEEYNPGTAVKSGEDIFEFIKNNVIGIFNPATTCNMGSSGDSLAVLDSQASVYSVTGLRIVNASVFHFLSPKHPPGVGMSEG
ncbi:CAZyme family AA3 [Penicillium pulvis]|uniref:CAZyme family AA3 n=1 Tax=Penicillium pulvis TaxID=1562058 RepID=UPI0025497D52|nr:CAZyme family AA3 [Penicillium pulvis]KAJ5784259.1 CAZyme family AA3 [Penicillium pulvis]